MGTLLLRALIAASIAIPSAALACGGFFCNAADPVVQAGENIVFVADGDQMHMIVQLTWGGPPTDFGWLLPVPADVETEVSTEVLFSQLNQYAPQYWWSSDYGPNCHPNNGEGGVGGDGGAGGTGGAGGEGGGGGGVQVLGRAAVGPYDRVILQAQTAEALTDWLGDNDFQYPQGAEAVLQPYIDLGLVFVALKLLPTADSNDVVPLHLTFTGQVPAIPLRPTSVAATPDMPVIAHIFGPSRAVPTNYPHLTLDPAALVNSRYPDVLAHAVDAAGGHAFVTNFAGPPAELRLWYVAEAHLRAIAAVETAEQLWNTMRSWRSDPDLSRILRTHLVPPGDMTVDQMLQCLNCEGVAETPVDGAALAEIFEREINDRRQALEALLATPYLTRLSTALSPEEMTIDPIFAFNPDLEPVSNVHEGIIHIACSEGGTQDREGVTYELSNGETYLRQKLPEPIIRQNGETVRGQDVQAVALIEQHFSAGQPEVIDDNRTPNARPWMGWGDGGAGGQLGVGGQPGAGGSGGRPSGAGGSISPTPDAGMGAAVAPTDDTGCSCQADDQAPGGSLGVLALLALLGLRRRRV